ncbi:large-conductance mechanosensitive channel protein MscL [Candidatus Beckwithbacteria bacterium]|nr:large-conductance mechanosensitive channel protein MscL [Candidatus Beckwithbacteria bacterium]
MLQKFFNEFKKFAMRGNVIDLAVGIIIGGAFKEIISSLVGDIIMPPLGLLLAKVDFADLYINLSGKHYSSLAAASEAGAPVISYGIFLNNVIDFTIVAFAVFLLVKGINQLQRKEEKEKKEKNKTCPFCFTKIPAKATRCPNCTSSLKG